MAKHNVQQGESIGSIAKQSGMFWETIWNHPENAALKQKRDDPNVLRPGDEVFIPETQLNHVEGGTQTRHRFRVKGVPALLQIQFLLNEKPRANEPYELDIDGLLSSGRTDGQGWINESIPPDAKKGKLTFDDEDQYEFQKRVLKSQLENLVLPEEHATLQAGHLLEDLPRLWSKANPQERHTILRGFLECVYVDLSGSVPYGQLRRRVWSLASKRKLRG